MNGAGGASPAAAASGAWRDQLRTALTGLGWSPREAEQAVVAVEPELTAMTAASGSQQPLDLAVALRVALRQLGRV